ncbi:MAG TPA: ABC transporter substrate-binding protein [Methylomirabilota bacterium]
MRTWTGLLLSLAMFLAAETTLASPAVGPRDAVEAAVARFMTIVQNGQSGGAAAAERTAEIRAIVRDMFDFDEISKRALSRHWQTLPTEEQAEFVPLFRDLLERAYLTQVESVEGEQIVFLGESIDAGGSAIVRSKLITRHGTEIPLDYRLHVLGGTWRIYDVIVQGISFITSYRSQFDRVIRVESYRALRDRLQKKVTETTAAQR